VTIKPAFNPSVRVSIALKSPGADRITDGRADPIRGIMNAIHSQTRKGQQMRRNAPRLTSGLVVAALCFAPLAAAADEARLAEAIKNQDTKTARTLIKQKVDVNATLPDGATALHWATQWDDVESADLLIAAGAKVDARDDYGVTPLSLASTNGNAAMIAKLLKAGANPNSALSTGETPLMTAARTGKLEAVKLLVAAGANVNAKEASREQTPLMWATAHRHVDVMKTLIAAGADVRARSKSGFTPLLFAAQAADVATTRVLLGAGVSINEAATNGTTALMVATNGGQTAYAKFLLDEGADPNLGPGYTPLHVVAGAEGHVSREEEGMSKLDFAKLLLAKGANPNFRATRSVQRTGFLGATPFFMAAWAADTTLMRVLVDAGADPNVPTTAGTTPLMAAAGILHSMGSDNTKEADALAAVKLCFELGNDVRAVNTSHGDTALHGAVYRGIEGGASIIEFLVEKGADIEAVNKRNWTPLLVAEGLYFSASHTREEGHAALLRKLGAKPSPVGFNTNAGLRSGEVWYEPGKEPATLGAAR
jgi:ankyrin repeat protein